MQTDDAKTLFHNGELAYSSGKTLDALVFFEKALLLEDNPRYYSFLGYCIAKERGQVNRGVSLCHEALRKEPDNSVHYLNLGKIYVLTGNKDAAIKLFRDGLHRENNQDIINELNNMGIRCEPVFRFLERAHPLNKYTGIIMKKLRLR